MKNYLLTVVLLIVCVVNAQHEIPAQGTYQAEAYFALGEQVDGPATITIWDQIKDSDQQVIIKWDHFQGGEVAVMLETRTPDGYYIGYSPSPEWDSYWVLIFNKREGEPTLLAAMPLIAGAPDDQYYKFIFKE